MYFKPFLSLKQDYIIYFIFFWLHQWWRTLETKCVGDKFSLTTLGYWLPIKYVRDGYKIPKNHQHEDKSRQLNDSGTNIFNLSPS